MRRSAFCVLFLMAVAPAVMGQGITGFTGGSLYGSYYGSLAPGDLSLIHISEPTRPELVSRMPSSA